MLWNAPQTVPVSLSERKKGWVYGEMRATGAVGHPAEFSAAPAGKPWMRGQVTPAPTYYLKVRSDGQVKELRWADDVLQPNPPEARRLRALMHLLIGIVATQQEIRALPEQDAWCL